MEEPHEAWVLEVVLPDMSGHALWGVLVGDDIDRVLTDADGRALLFSSPAALTTYLAAMSDPPPVTIEEDGGFFDMVEVAALLGRPAEQWDIPVCAEVLHGINLLGDIAVSVGLEAIFLDWANGPVGALLDVLTFITVEELPDALVQVNPRGILDTYLADLAAVTARTRLVT